MELGRDLGMEKVWVHARYLSVKKVHVRPMTGWRVHLEGFALDSRPGSEYSSNMLFLMRYNQGLYPPGAVPCVLSI